jgi:threonine dehydratase
MIPLIKFQEAGEVIKGNIFKTPLVYSPTLSQTFGAEIYLKLENLQKTGSFKIRGATYKILSKGGGAFSRGVVAASAGNHAQGVALAATQAGIPSTIVMPEWVSISKQEATRNYGGRVVIDGQSLEKSLEAALKLSRDESLYFIHPYDDPDIIIGQGTVALEIFEELDDIDLIIVPIGGGGLISGIGSVTRSISPKAKVIGVQSAACASAYQSVREGRIVQVPSRASIAEGISVKQIGDLNFEIIQKAVDDIVLVEEQYIASAILMLLERKKVLAEGAGAVSLAALMNGSIVVKEKSKVVLVISGGNVDSPLLGRIISQGLIKNGRIMHFLVKLDDTPGSLARLLNLVAELQANVLDIHHERYIRDTPLYVTHVELELETRGHPHVEAIKKALLEQGYLFTL